MRSPFKYLSHAKKIPKFTRTKYKGILKIIISENIFIEPIKAKA